MKKALLLGVLAFFALNTATVQNVNAQDKKEAVKVTKKTTEKDKESATYGTPAVNPNENNETPQSYVKPDPKKQDDLNKTEQTSGDRTAKPQDNGKNTKKMVRPGKNDPKTVDNNNTEKKSSMNKPSKNDMGKTAQTQGVSAGKEKKQGIKKTSKNDMGKTSQAQSSDNTKKAKKAITTKDKKNDNNGKNDKKNPNQGKLKSAKASTIK